MCGPALALAGPGLACLFFGLLGVVASRTGEGAGPMLEEKEDEAAWEMMTRIELRIFRFLSVPLVAAGSVLVLTGIFQATQC